MSKRMTFKFLAAAATASLLALAWLFAAASPAPAAATKVRTVPIVMADPGCHWFLVGGQKKVSLTVNGPTAFRNLDEAALVFKGTSFVRKVAVGKTITVAKPGVYHITMVGQHSDDNHLKLTVK